MSRELSLQEQAELGDVSAWAQDALVCAVSDPNYRGAVHAWIQRTRDELAEPGDTGLEALLIHRVCLCQLAAEDAEERRAHAWGGSGGITHESADFWDRHVSRLSADLCRATRALAQVRKLRRPVVQVNIAEQQVNVANVNR